MAEYMNHGVGSFNFNVYPASQPIMTALMEAGTIKTLMDYGVRVKSAFADLALAPAIHLPTTNSPFATQRATSRTAKALTQP